MKTAADYRRAELRRRLRRATVKIREWKWYQQWAGSFKPFLSSERRSETALAGRQIAYWADIARILRRTLREEGKGTR